MPGGNTETTEGINQNHKHIDCEKGNTIENRKSFINLYCCSCVIAKLRIQTLFFTGFLIECPNDTNACNIF